MRLNTSNYNVINRLLDKDICVVCCLLCAIFFTGCARSSHTIDVPRELKAVREKNLQVDLQHINKPLSGNESSKEDGKQSIDWPITLDLAVEYAIKNNLDAAISKMEYEIQYEALTEARLKMLPALTLNGEFSRRSNRGASFSETINTITQEIVKGDPSFSRDKESQTADLKFSWGLLDFSIAYLQQKQAADVAAIADQKHRRAMQNLKLDVTEAYWQLQVAKSAKKMAERFIERLKKRKKILEGQYIAQTVSEITVLRTSATLAEMALKMTKFEMDERKYYYQLSKLMGLPRSVTFQVKKHDFKKKPHKKDFDVSALEIAALEQRPELFEKDLEERISVYDAKIAVTKMFPNFSLFADYNYDADSHIVEESWNTAGLKVSFDLLSMGQKRSKQRQANIKQTMIKKKRLSIAKAVMIQLNLAIANYKDAIRKYNQLKLINVRRQKLLRALIRHSRLGAGKIEDVLKSEAKYLFARVDMLESYAGLMIATERIFNTIGQSHLGVEGQKK